MKIPFFPGILILLLFNIIFAKYWCEFADLVGKKICLKKLIEWILNKFNFI